MVYQNLVLTGIEVVPQLLRLVLLSTVLVQLIQHRFNVQNAALVVVVLRVLEVVAVFNFIIRNVLQDAQPSFQRAHKAASVARVQMIVLVGFQVEIMDQTLDLADASQLPSTRSTTKLPWLVVIHFVNVSQVVSKISVGILQGKRVVLKFAADALSLLERLIPLFAASPSLLVAFLGLMGLSALLDAFLGLVDVHARHHQVNPLRGSSVDLLVALTGSACIFVLFELAGVAGS